MLRMSHLSLIIFLIAFLVANPVIGQSDANQQIIDEVRSQLAVMSAENGSLRKFCDENKITGTFVFDLTIEGKGDVSTVFLVSSDTQDIASRNLIKDKIYTLRFDNIKIPKKQRVKFRHTLNF